MIGRNSKHYTSGYKGSESDNAPLYLRSLVFDSPEGDFNESLIRSFNAFVEKENISKGCGLILKKEHKTFPKKIVVINASHDNLPTSYETARAFEDYLKRKDIKTPVKVVNTREELLLEVEEDPRGVLVMSQCVNKHVYDVALAEEFTEKGVTIVPGKVTAPGGVFSDKDSTYKLLSDSGKNWSEVARYRKISPSGKTVREVVDDIFIAINELEEETGDSTFFVKPHEGGGGLGGFRITKTSKGFIIPDLSKVTGEEAEVHPTFIDFDTQDEDKLRELLWIYRLFSTDEKMSANYIKVDLPILDAEDDEAISILKKYLEGSKEARHKKLKSLSMSELEAKKKLTEAITTFEKKFSRKYVPLVNEHIDFGLWGLRAHYRLTHKGPILETLYHRIFQLGFTEEGLGYLGSDNISNKQTGDLEILRLGPINEVMLASIGGEKNLFETLLKGAKALIQLSELLPEKDKGHVPLRLQVDLAAISKRIGEGNADTARGISIASRWPEFVRNSEEWLEDSLEYYAFNKETG